MKFQRKVVTKLRDDKGKRIYKVEFFGKEFNKKENEFDVIIEEVEYNSRKEIPTLKYFNETFDFEDKGSK